MYDGMQYDPIQGQGHEPLKVGNSATFNRFKAPTSVYHYYCYQLIHEMYSRRRGRASVCLFVRALKENGLSYQHQTWYTYTL